MAKKITQDQVVEKNLWQNTIDSTKLLIEVVDKLDASLKKVATDSKAALNSNSKQDFSGLKGADEEVKKVNRAFEDKIKLDKQRLTLQKQLEKARLSELKLQKDREAAFDRADKKEQTAIKNAEKLIATKKKEASAIVAATEKERLASLKLQKSRQAVSDKLDAQQNKAVVAAQKLRKTTADSANAFKILTKQVNSAQARFKRLAAQYGVNSEEAVRANIKFAQLDDRLRRINKTARDGRRDVGRYGTAFSKLGGFLKGGLGFLGITAGVAAFTRVLTNTIKIAKDFEQGNANLASVLGTTKESIGALTTDAKRLGAATSFSATQVTELQTEFAKLGFNEQEILNATEATLDLAAATGSDLGEAAAIAGATLGGFGLDASETGRVADVMAKSFSTSALDLEKFKESMKDAAPAAKAVGVSVEKTTALLGTLSNAGIAGSKAGTALKAGFIELNAAGIDLDEGLEKIANSEDKLATATALVGKKAATSFLVLADGVDVTKELERGLNNAGGSAKKMADEQLNTLEGKTKILNSAWEGLVLSLLSGDGAFSSISKGLVEMATNLLGVLTPAEELEASWYGQRDAVNDLEESLNPLLDRHDELKEKTELTKDEQKELDDIILKVAEDVPSAVTEFDKYGKALSISTSATREFIQQSKDLLALDNAAAISEQQEIIIGLINQQDFLGRTYKNSKDGLLIYNRELEKATNGKVSFIKATTEEILQFQKQSKEIAKNIALRSAKIRQLRGEKTLLELAADAENNKNKVSEEGNEITKTATTRSKEKIDKITEESTLLETLKDQLDAINEAREKIVFTPNSEEAFKELTEDAKKLEQQIQIIKDKLSGAEDKDKKLAGGLKPGISDSSFLKDEKDRLDKEAQQEIDNRKKVLSVLQALNDKFFADKLKKADEEIDSTKKRGEQLENLAAQGNEDAAKSLGQNQKDQAEANKKKEELLQKEKQFELALAVISAFNTALEKPGATTGSALTEAITSTTVLTSFVASLPSFFDGTTDTGNNGSLDSNGGHMAMLHDNERVVDKANNSKMGGVSNDFAADIIHDFNNDLLSYNSPQLLIKENRFDSNEQILSKFDTLEKSIVSAINNKETYLGSDIDTIKKMIFQNYSKDGTKTKVKSKFTTRK